MAVIVVATCFLARLNIILASTLLYLTGLKGTSLQVLVCNSVPLLHTCVLFNQLGWYRS
jgi:hypothetical protein